MTRFSILSLAALAVGATVVAQAVTPRPGFRAESVREVNVTPQTYGAIVVGPIPGVHYVARNSRVQSLHPDGSVHTLHTLPQNHEFGVLAIPPGSTELFFTDFDADLLFRFDIIAGTLTSQPIPTNTFDLELSPQGDILVVANPTFPMPPSNSGVWLVDPNGGTNHREIVQLTGPSGPLAVDPTTGDLCVAVIPFALPPAPGSVQLHRFGASDVQQTIASPSATALVTSQAIDSTALDGAYDLAFDTTTRLYVSDVNNATVLRTTPGSFTFENEPFATITGQQFASLQFSAIGHGTFEPFQPSTGGTLFCGVNVTPSRIGLVTITPRRPELSTSVGNAIAAGPWYLQLRGFPQHTNAWLCLSTLPTVPEFVALPFDARPLWLGLNVTAPITSVAVALDALGDATLAFDNRGAGISISLQAIGFDLDSVPTLASSNPLWIQLLP